ncbi:putative zinc metalloprotease, family M4 [Lanmaoa asiatica]|nr:putative zinc metalloprotease, family M4 [Lanmaoa asiatica]
MTLIRNRTAVIQRLRAAGSGSGSGSGGGGDGGDPVGGADDGGADDGGADDGGPGGADDGGPGGGDDDGAIGGAPLNRLVYDSENTEEAALTLRRAEGDPPSPDVAVNECYDGFGATFNFFNDIFNRNSIDGLGMNIIGSVHYDQDLMNAFWDGEQMLFGDGDGVFWTRLTASLDVIGHELTHGVTQFTANLDYQGEAGALNESVSDVFGSMIKQFQLGQNAAQADWLIGAEIFIAPGAALRSMIAPGTAYDHPVLGQDPQPDNYADVLANPMGPDDDFGGVHVFSGVPNRAFYLVAIALGGNSWDRAGRVWYATLTGGGLNPAATFMQFATLTVQNAEALFDAAVRAVVVDAWNTVGVAVV